MSERGWLRIVLAYALWFAVQGAIVLIILVARQTISFAMVLTSWDRFTKTLTNEVVVLLLGLGGIVFVVVVEHAFRTAPSYSALLRRAALTMAVALIVLAALHGLSVMVAVGVGGPYTLRLEAVFFELLAAMLLLWIRGHLLPRETTS